VQWDRGVQMLMIKTFDAAVIDADRRLAAWSSFLASHNCKAVADTSLDHFAARLTALTTPWNFSLINLHISAQRLIFDARGHAGGNWLIRVAEGSGTLRTERGSVEFSEGEMIYGRVPREVALTAVSRLTLHCAYFQRRGSGQRLASLPAPLVAASLKQEFGSAAFLSELMRTAAERIGSISSDEIRPLEIAVTEFFMAAVATTNAAGNLLEGSSTKNAIALRATQAIESHLCDPELSPAAVAGHVGISVRYLQKLFEEAGENVNHYIRRRRLERSHEELTDPLYSGQSIAEISFRWGFNDSAYFSRTFKELYGLSPSQHRESWRWHEANGSKGHVEGRSSRISGLKSG
jgi:AraC-like DNA-binding protein